MRHVLVLGLLTVTISGAMEAQGDTRLVPSPAVVDGWLVAGSVGLPGIGSETEPLLFTVGLNWTRLRDRRLGADFSLGTMPWVLGQRAIVAGGRGGAAFPLAIGSNALLIPSAGLSAIAAVGSGGGGGIGGLNAGVATVLYGDGPLGLRVGMTWHRFSDGDFSVWLFEIGPARVPLRARRPGR